MSDDQVPTRGERNNNPGNIDYQQPPASPWRGQVGIESAAGGEARFIRFDEAKNGLRAVARTLTTYQRNHGCRSVRDLIKRWAPPKENDTDAYVSAVASRVGVDPDASIDVTNASTLRQLTRAIVVHENGRCIYDDDTIAAAVDSALS